MFGFDMNLSPVDIIVSVWNKPEKTRLCLAELVRHTPEARFIFMDNASERETEILLHEFAEALGERALLFGNDKVRDSVAVVNAGLAKAEAPVVVLVDNTTVVGKGWLEPMLDMISNRPDVGLVVPDIVLNRGELPAGKKPSPVRPIEVCHGSFAALLVRKSLYDRIGGFDEGMDGGYWCLKDYSRRAWKEGYVSVNASGVTVSHEEIVPLGSPARREARLKQSMAKFIYRWGEEQSFCVDMSGEIDPGNIKRQFEIMLSGARCGCSFTVVAHHKAYREIVKEGYNFLHKNIAVERIPFIFASGTADRVFSRLRKNAPNMSMISVAEQLVFTPCRGAAGSQMEANTFSGGPHAG